MLKRWYRDSDTTAIVAWLSILIGAVLNIRLVGPLINSIIQAHKQIKESESRLADLSKQLSRYLSPQIYQSIFEGKKTASIGSHRKKLTVFLSDIVGFTDMTDSMEPEMQHLEPGFELNINLDEVHADQQDALLHKLKSAISMIEGQKR